MRVSRAATAAVLVAATATSLSAQPAPRALNLARDERGAIAALQAAAAGPDRAAQDAALAAARAAARGADARYAIAHYQLEIARVRGDQQLYTQAVDALVDTGLATPDELPALLQNQAARAYAARDMVRADRLLARVVELQPNNVEALADYAQFRSRSNSRAPAERTLAVQLFARAVGASQANGRLAPESLYRRALAVAYDSSRPPIGLTALAPQTIALGRALVGAYPSPINWRDALLAYRELSPGDPALDLDIRRLMRAASALAGERDYLDLAQALDSAGLPGEAKAVLDEGVSRGLLDSAKPAIAQTIAATGRRAAADRAGLARLHSQGSAAGATGGQARAAADAHFAVGQYGEAADLYQAALQKGGEDPNLVGSRLGAALALAGRRPEAEIALRAVTGPRADLAGFWLVWLARRPAA